MQTLDIGMVEFWSGGRSAENVVDAGALLIATTSCSRLLHLAFSIATDLDLSYAENFGKLLVACSIFCEYLSSLSGAAICEHKTNGFPSHWQLVSH